MARVALVPTAVSAAGVVDPTGTASVAGAGNGFTIAAPGAKHILLRVANASGGSGTVSVLAGSQPTAIASGQGANTVTVANATTQWVGPFESARVIQSDGSLAIETSVVMTITAFSIDGRYVG